MSGFHYLYPDHLTSMRDGVIKFDYMSFITGSIPITRVCRHYNFRQNALRDLLAGIGVGMSTIPQALGYATMLGIPASYGLYSNVFSSLIFSLFTSSVYNSITISVSGVLFGLDALNSLGQFKIRKQKQEKAKASESCEFIFYGGR